MEFVVKKGGAHDLLEDEMLSKEKAYEDKVFSWLSVLFIFCRALRCLALPCFGLSSVFSLVFSCLVVVLSCLVFV